MAKRKVFDYPGAETTVHWHGGLCIHIAECGRARGELFVGGRKPWCDPDLSSVDEIRDVISRCPSGALTASYPDGAAGETAPAENTVQVAYNGPLFVTGDLAIEGAPDDAPGVAFRAALCRCGKSANKPFCDNSHLESGFRDYGAVGEAGPGADEEGGPLEIRPAKDGPLLVKGNVTIRAASGRHAWRGRQAALCRCGASENKPFCDGSHKKVGFSGD